MQPIFSLSKLLFVAGELSLSSAKLSRCRKLEIQLEKSGALNWNNLDANLQTKDDFHGTSIIHLPSDYYCAVHQKYQPFPVVKMSNDSEAYASQLAETFKNVCKQRNLATTYEKVFQINAEAARLVIIKYLLARDQNIGNTDVQFSDIELDPTRQCYLGKLVLYYIFFFL